MEEMNILQCCNLLESKEAILKELNILYKEEGNKPIRFVCYDKEFCMYDEFGKKYIYWKDYTILDLMRFINEYSDPKGNRGTTELPTTIS